MTERRAKGYPGRDRLNDANMRFRAALAQLHREGQRDPDTAGKLLPLVDEAVQTLERLALCAVEAAGNSARWKASAAAEAERALQIVKPGYKPRMPRPDLR